MIYLIIETESDKMTTTERNQIRTQKTKQERNKKQNKTKKKSRFWGVWVCLLKETRFQNKKEKLIYKNTMK